MNPEGMLQYLTNPSGNITYFGMLGRWVDPINQIRTAQKSDQVTLRMASFAFPLQVFNTLSCSNRMIPESDRPWTNRENILIARLMASSI